MVFLRAVVFCFLCSLATCTREKMIEKIQVESEGIDDHKMAPEYKDVWTNDATLTSLESDAMSEMNEMNLGVSDLTALDKEKLIRRSWLLESQKKVNAASEGCPSLVLWCEPTRKEFDGEEGFKSVLITREKGWGDKLKWNPKRTNCSRVGFEVFQGGKLLKEEADMKTTAFNLMYGLKHLRWITIEQDDQYLEHCEWLRLRHFDMRHAVECVKHSKLCNNINGKGEATAIPYAEQKPKDVSRETSKHGPTSLTFGENSKPAVEIFANALEEREQREHQEAFQNAQVTEKTCIELLCKYKGFKKASLKLHPDRLLRMKLTEEEKEEKTHEFKYLVNCKDGFKGPDGKELTLNKKEDRESLCE